jgi:hypothetical protein
MKRNTNPDAKELASEVINRNKKKVDTRLAYLFRLCNINSSMNGEASVVNLNGVHKSDRHAIKRARFCHQHNAQKLSRAIRSLLLTSNSLA